MISEERIKELALEMWRHPKVAFQTDDCEIVLEILSQYFRTVAAEAREEGIEEMRDATIESLLYITYPYPPRQELADMVSEGAKKIKEKGK